MRSTGTFLALLSLLTAGCTRTFTSSVTQPNPLEQPLETLRESEEVVIVTGDMELKVPKGGSASGGRIWVDERYPLHNTARFFVVSRDRLRFHVQIEHKWQEWADVTTWDATLVDDKGRRYTPSQVDRRSDRHIVQMWDYEQRTAVRNAFGDIVNIKNDGYKRRQPLGSLSLFRGKGDFVFYHRDIFDSDVKSLTLHLERDGTAFEFMWRFADEDAVALREERASSQ